MPNRKRQGNDPTRRIIPIGTLGSSIRSKLDKTHYVGSAHHKRHPADYGFTPPVNPRPSKSLCDDVRIIKRREAIKLFRSGIHLDMVSSCLRNGLPKYVWAVDNDGNVFEAKWDSDGYHGYRLRLKDSMRAYVVANWKERSRHDDSGIAN